MGHISSWSVLMMLFNGRKREHHKEKHRGSLLYAREEIGPEVNTEKTMWLNGTKSLYKGH
jgi:hypothetical protein